MSAKTDVLSGSELTIDQFELVVIDGPSKGARCQSNGDDVVIGSADGATMQLDDTAVSGFHCRLSASPLGIRVSDEGSTNGTFLEDVRRGLGSARCDHGWALDDRSVGSRRGVQGAA